MAYTRKDVSSTELEFEMTIPSSEFEKKYEEELSEVAKQVKVAGFRPGKVPMNMIGESQKEGVRKHVLEHIISDEAANVLKTEKVVPAMPPSVSISSFKQGFPLKFKLTVLVIPPVSIPPFSSLTAKKLSVKVEDKDIDLVEKTMWEQHRGKFKDKSDEWVAEVAPKLGFKAKKMIDLRDEIKSAVEREKQRIADQQFAHDVLMEAIEKADVQVPEKVFMFEAEEREKSFLSNLHDMNMTVEEYVKNRKVTLEEMRAQWMKDSKEAVKTDVLLSEYARSRKVAVSEEELNAEIALLKTQAKNPSDPLFDNSEWRGYIRRVILKRKSVQAFLDELLSSRR